MLSTDVFKKTVNITPSEGVEPASHWPMAISEEDEWFVKTVKHIWKT